MKNIHILPTDKETRLFISESELILAGYPKTTFKTGKNIYITNDEEIKDDDWVYCPVLKKPVFICLDSILMFKNLGYDSKGNSVYKKEWLKKIILTTDQDLIADGVQAIDDEFLEWFVKNPSCEFVKFKKKSRCCGRCNGVDDLCYTDMTCDKHQQNGCEECYGKRVEYEIIIPQEEARQNFITSIAPIGFFPSSVISGNVTSGIEPVRSSSYYIRKPKHSSLEEAAERYTKDKWEPSQKENKESFIEGAKWQSAQNKNSSIRLEKHEVCVDCYSIGISHIDCICGYQNNYPTIELEFEVCGCCGNVVEDGSPAETQFNWEQFKKNSN
jgi:hypothetical protein